MTASIFKTSNGNTLVAPLSNGTTAVTRASNGNTAVSPLTNGVTAVVKATVGGTQVTPLTTGTTVLTKASTGNTVVFLDFAGPAFPWAAVLLTWPTWTAVKAANPLWQDVVDA